MKKILLTGLLLIGVSASAIDTGGLVGGAIGGILGNQVGGGSGKVAATIGGAVLGTMIGTGERTAPYQEPTYNRRYTYTRPVYSEPVYNNYTENRYSPREVYIERPIYRENNVKTYVQRVDDFGNKYFVQVQD